MNSSSPAFLKPSTARSRCTFADSAQESRHVQQRGCVELSYDADGGAILTPTLEPVAELRGVTKIYREGERRRTVLNHVDLKVAPGELLILLGRSGSGKSTVLNLLAGIDAPTEGEVLLGGKPLSQLPERDRTLLRRDKIGFIFQFFNLIPTLTVEENLLLPLELSGRLDPTERRRALELLDSVGLADRARSFPDVLSGGEQQRVAIARALAHDPLLLIADEPTGNLDLETAHEIIALLESSARGAAKTLVVATHSRDVAALGDRVLAIEDGHFVERQPEPEAMPATATRR